MIKAGIVGGTGYTGVELLRLLAGHDGIEVAAITSRGEAGRPVADLFPNLRGHYDGLAFGAPNLEALVACDVVFFATPHATAMETVPALIEQGVRVVDLSADFRLKDATEWAHWYGVEHACPELIEQAVYGLPEIHREQIASAQLVAAPGCYPTAVQLGFLPLLESGLVDADRLVADAKSGVSGAGRGAKVGSLFCEAGESLQAYAVSGHRHLPEIRQGLQQAHDGPVGLTFVPHLTPMIRGIHATLYSCPKGPIEPATLQAVFEDRYRAEPAVDVVPAGSHPATRSVRGTNLCRIAVQQQGDMIVVLSVIDNLVKGAAGQALQCCNLMFGLPEMQGLDLPALLP